MIEPLFRETKFDNPEDLAAQSNITGTFIIITMNSTVDITRAKFYDGIAYLGGAISLQSWSSLTVSLSEFYSNYAYLYGGAVYATNFASLIIDEKTRLFNNKALDKGDDIYALSNNGKVSLDSVSLTNPTAKNSIYAEFISLEIKGTAF